MIPLRRYFVRDTHGEFPFPEATAITEVLVTGERGGSQARLLLQATAIAGVYDFFVTTFQVWREYVNLQFVPAVRALADQARMVVAFDAVAFILGLGYVMGLRSSMVLVSGGVLSNLVLVPLVWMIGQHLPDAVYPGTSPISGMTAGADLPELRPLHRRRRHRHGRNFRHLQVAPDRRRLIRDRGPRLPPRRGDRRADRPRRAGPGPVARRDRRHARRRCILRQPPRLADCHPRRPGPDARLLVLLHLRGRHCNCDDRAEPGLGHDHAHGHHLVGGAAAVRRQRAIGMFFVMAIAGMVCTALSVSGQFITDLKTGYWLGSTPAAQQRVKFLGVIASAAAVGLTIVMLAARSSSARRLPATRAPCSPRRRRRSCRRWCRGS
jgi:hypothetical protein